MDPIVFPATVDFSRERGNALEGALPVLRGDDFEIVFVSLGADKAKMKAWRDYFAAAPRMYEFIKLQAESGDGEAAAILESIEECAL